MPPRISQLPDDRVKTIARMAASVPPSRKTLPAAVPVTTRLPDEVLPENSITTISQAAAGTTAPSLPPIPHPAAQRSPKFSTLMSTAASGNDPTDHENENDSYSPSPSPNTSNAP